MGLDYCMLGWDWLRTKTMCDVARGGDVATGAELAGPDTGKPNPGDEP